MKNPDREIVNRPTQQAFEALFTEHWAHVYRLLCRLVGDPAEAEDLALEAFIRLHRQDALQQRDFNAGGWLHRVATNLGLHSLRSWKRRQRYELEAGRFALEEQAGGEDPAEEAARAGDLRAVRQALAGMNERQARLLVLRYGGSSYREIAAALGLSPASIGPLLLRAEREFDRRYRALTKEEQ